MSLEISEFRPEELLAKGSSNAISEDFLNHQQSPRDNLEEPKEGWQKLDIEDPIEMLFLVDENIQKGTIVLHSWQVETQLDLARAKPSNRHPHKFCLCAANGSGKDEFIVAPFAVWFIVSKIKSKVIITSSSGVQLTNQTENYIRSLCDKINAWAIENLGGPILKIRQRRITCTASGSEIFLFATDEGTKAEGYHPSANAEMAIIVNEAKSVSSEIFGALRRCTGYNYWINVSTPGEPVGDFFESFERWPHKKRITYFDCPHHSPDEYEYDKQTMGEHDPLFRSKWLALFTYVGGRNVVSQMALEKLRRKVKCGEVIEILKDRPIRVGIDIALSTNGDETVVTAFRGNKQILLETFRIKDATVLALNLSQILKDKLKLDKTHPYIFLDEGGIGRPVIDFMKRLGWTSLHRIQNQSPAKNKKNYRNRGAELWYKFSKLVENGVVILLDNEKLYKQILSRKYRDTEAGIDRLILQSKREMISEGLPSPDRADATVLAFTDSNVDEFINAYSTTEYKTETPKEEIEDMVARLQRELREGEKQAKPKKKNRFSLNSLIGVNRRNERLSKWMK